MLLLQELGPLLAADRRIAADRLALVGRTEIEEEGADGAIVAQACGLAAGPDHLAGRRTWPAGPRRASRRGLGRPWWPPSRRPCSSRRSPPCRWLRWRSG